MKRDDFANEIEEIDKLIKDFGPEFDDREAANGWTEGKRSFMIGILHDLKSKLMGGPTNKDLFDFGRLGRMWDDMGNPTGPLTDRVRTLSKTLRGCIPGHQDFLYKWFGYRKPIN
ncbi:MAG: hypothetical protein ABJA67_03835 [Chthonomonadales bacterium]